MKQVTRYPGELYEGIARNGRPFTVEDRPDAVPPRGASIPSTAVAAAA